MRAEPFKMEGNKLKTNCIVCGCTTAFDSERDYVKIPKSHHVEVAVCNRTTFERWSHSKSKYGCRVVLDSFNTTAITLVRTKFGVLLRYFQKQQRRHHPDEPLLGIYLMTIFLRKEINHGNIEHAYRQARYEEYCRNHGKGRPHHFGEEGRKAAIQAYWVKERQRRSDAKDKRGVA